MARTDNLSNFLSDVADAIRTKTGEAGTIPASAFDSKIVNIPSGGLEPNADIKTYYVAANEEVAAGDFIELIQGVSTTPGQHENAVIVGQHAAGDDTSYRMSRLDKLVQLSDNILLADMYCSTRGSYYYGVFKYNSESKRFEFARCRMKDHSNKQTYKMQKAIPNWAICWDYYDDYAHPSFIYCPDDGSQIGETTKGYLQQATSGTGNITTEWLNTGAMVFYRVYGDTDVLYQFVGIADSNEKYNNYTQTLKTDDGTQVTGMVKSYGFYTDGRIILHAGNSIYLVQCDDSTGKVTSCQLICSGVGSIDSQRTDFRNNKLFYVSGSGSSCYLKCNIIDFENKSLVKTLSAALPITPAINQTIENNSMGMINDEWFYAIGTTTSTSKKNQICYCRITEDMIEVYDPIDLDQALVGDSHAFQESGIFVWSDNDLKFYIHNVAFPEMQAKKATTQKNDGLAKTAGVGGTTVQHKDTIQVYVPNN